MAEYTINTQYEIGKRFKYLNNDAMIIGVFLGASGEIMYMISIINHDGISRHHINEYELEMIIEQNKK